MVLKIIHYINCTDSETDFPGKLHNKLMLRHIDTNFVQGGLIA